MPLSSVEKQDLLELAEAPAAKDGGESLNEYDEFQEELAKLSPGSGARPDWQEIEKLGGKLLEKGCKSLWVAGYFGEALFRNHGLSGLETAAQLLGKLIAGQGEAGFPGYPQDRQLGDLKKINERWSKFGPDGLKEGLSAEDASHCLAVLDGFEADLRARYGEGKMPEYFLFELRKKLRPEAEQAPAPADAPEGNLPAALAAKGPWQPRSRVEALAMLKLVADYFEEHEPHSPLPYVLRRSMEWGGMKFPELIVELLPGNTGGRDEIYRMAGYKKPDTNK
jgi:predicted component of type VI protein secretion system